MRSILTRFFVISIKLGAHQLDTDSLRAATCRLQEFGQHCETERTEPRSTPPVGFKTRAPFYSPDVLRKVLLVMDFLADECEGDEQITDAMRLAFAATMVDYSNYSYEPSLGRKATVGRPEVTDFPVIQTLVEKLDKIADDADWYRENRMNPTRQGGIIYQASFLHDYRRIDKHSVNLVLTSPPYMNNYHYNRNTRPQMYWLGFSESPQELKLLEKLNFGTYWQNARDQPPIPLNPVIQDDEIHDTLDRIRERNQDRGVYGGGGWANYATAYLNDCVRFMRGLRWALHPEGTGLIVIGNSIIQGIPVPTDRFMASIAQQCGLEVRRIETPREARVGSSIINSAVRNGQVEDCNNLYESVVEIGQRS